MPFARGPLLAASLASACALAITAAPVGAAPGGLDTLATTPVRSPIVGDAFVFVMTDRYANGDPANDAGGGAPFSTGGFDPSSPAFFHGGDLRGLTGRCEVADPADVGLARLRRLGFTAVWITPVVVNMAVSNGSAGYHGYWGMDFTSVDPHLGSQADMAALTACARRLGMKVFLDVVTNHTADVISYAQGPSYVPVEERPYRTAAGVVFRPFRYARANRPLPALSTTRSFAKTPSVPAALAAAKAPAILNDLTRYHNRGDIDWGSCSGSCEMDGDFSGLDDLMTEDAGLVDALATTYGDWVARYGLDGFRIDTAKHLDPWFVSRWLPRVQQRAAAAGRPSFTAFGEVWLTDPTQLAEQMLERGLPSVLDFPFQESAVAFATGRSGAGTLAALFDADDRYTSATTSAYGLATFLGNHDMGRIGFFVRTAGGSPGDQLARDLLAHDLLLLTRGVPVVYAGDEVGMTGSGDGRDQRARQDMFPTQVAEWRTEPRIGGAPIGTGSSFAVASPIADRIAALNALRAAHPALAAGAQVTRLTRGPVFAASRIDAAQRREYVVAFNGDGQAQAVTIPTSTPGASWESLVGGPAASSGPDGALRVTVPARGTVVLRASSELPAAPTASVTLRVSPDPASGRYRATATVPGSDPATVTFLMKRPGRGWTALGADDAAPFRVYIPADGSRAQVAAVVRTTSGATAQSRPIAVRLAPLY